MAAPGMAEKALPALPSVGFDGAGDSGLSQRIGGNKVTEARREGLERELKKIRPKLKLLLLFAPQTEEDRVECKRPGIHKGGPDLGVDGDVQHRPGYGEI